MLIEKEKDEVKLKSWSHFLFEQSVIAEGGKLDDPAGFIQNMNQALIDMVKQN